MLKFNLNNALFYNFKIHRKNVTVIKQESCCRTQQEIYIMPWCEIQATVQGSWDGLDPPSSGVRQTSKLLKTNMFIKFSILDLVKNSPFVIVFESISLFFVIYTRARGTELIRLRPLSKKFYQSAVRIRPGSGRMRCVRRMWLEQSIRSYKYTILINYTIITESIRSWVGLLAVSQRSWMKLYDHSRK